MVPKRGLEPPRPDGHYTLNVARLPIPPLRQEPNALCDSEVHHVCNILTFGRDECQAEELRDRTKGKRRELLVEKAILLVVNRMRVPSSSVAQGGEVPGLEPSPDSLRTLMAARGQRWSQAARRWPASAPLLCFPG